MTLTPTLSMSHWRQKTRESRSCCRTCSDPCGGQRAEFARRGLDAFARRDRMRLTKWLTVFRGSRVLRPRSEWPGVRAGTLLRNYVGAWRCERNGSRSKAAATSQTVPPTSELRCGPGRDAAPHRSTGTDDGQGREEDHELNYTATVRTHPLPQATTRKCLPPGCVQHLCLRLLDERNGFSGTPWSRSRSSCPWCKSSTFTCRVRVPPFLLGAGDRSSSSRSSGRGEGRSSPCSAGGRAGVGCLAGRTS